MIRLFLVRHGEPEAGWGEALDDPGLSKRGWDQARVAAEALAALGPLALVSSPLRRCDETAAPYAAQRGAAPVLEARVGEVAAPAGVIDRRAWLLGEFPWRGGPMRHWRDLAPELAAWRAAMLGFVGGLPEDTVVFTHFVAINVIVGAALGRDETIVCKPGYASITELSLDRGALKLVALGEEMRMGEVR
jgi:broad specificity phosphatase PhoE